MFGLKGRRDAYKFCLPKEFICPEIEEKYAKILRDKHGFYISPIDFINESIQKIQVLGFQNATVQQKQPGTGFENVNLVKSIKDERNLFPHSATDVTYRAAASPLDLIDKTFNIEFKHSLGYLNYFLLFENFFYLYARDTANQKLINKFTIDILNETGCIYCKLHLYYPVINGMDMLDFDMTQPVSQSQTFKMEIKYSNFDFEFIEITDENNDPYNI